MYIIISRAAVMFTLFSKRMAMVLWIVLHLRSFPCSVLSLKSNGVRADETFPLDHTQTEMTQSGMPDLQTVRGQVYLCYPSFTGPFCLFIYGMTQSCMGAGLLFQTDHRHYLNGDPVITCANCYLIRWQAFSAREDSPP